MPVDCKTHDYLDEDPAIRGQSYVCLSFLSPEDAIRSKDAHALSRFASSFTAEAREAIKGIVDRLGEDDARTINNVVDRYRFLFDETELCTEFDAYRRSNAAEIDAEYAAKNDFQACIRGIKVRGSYDTLEEAQSRAERLRKSDPNFHVYVGSVGCWCPWAPDPNDIQNAEYGETQLNTLMKKYKENVEERDELYNQRKDRQTGVRVRIPDAAELVARDAAGAPEATPDVAAVEATPDVAAVEATPDVATVEAVEGAAGASV
jgi:hypothetical protein